LLVGYIPFAEGLINNTDLQTPYPWISCIDRIKLWWWIIRITQLYIAFRRIRRSFSHL